jgi:hypothetical protein
MSRWLSKATPSAASSVVDGANPARSHQVPGNLSGVLGEGLVCVVRAAGGAAINHRLIDMTPPGSKTHGAQRATHTPQLRSLSPYRSEDSGAGISPAIGKIVAGRMPATMG